MKVMISQPMYGKSEKQIRDERNIIIKKFAKQEIEVVDTIFDIDIKMSTKHIGVFYLGLSIEEMSKVDAVYFMKGWQSARGCRIERQIAEEYGIKILETDYFEKG